VRQKTKETEALLKIDQNRFGFFCDDDKKGGGAD
jgi:hypothetical protein